MIEDDQLYLTHIGECLERIHRYTGGSKDRYTGSELVRDAVERNLETLCDAMGMLSGHRAFHPVGKHQGISE